MRLATRTRPLSTEKIWREGGYVRGVRNRTVVYSFVVETRSDDIRREMRKRALLTG